jgi:hypothetical protein
MRRGGGFAIRSSLARPRDARSRVRAPARLSSPVMHAVCYWIYGVEIRSRTSRKRAYLEELWLRNVTAAQAV